MYLYGASGHAKVILSILEDTSIPVSGIFDDNPGVTDLNGVKTLGRYAGQQLDAPLIISIGDNFTRFKIAKQLQVLFGTAIHPSAVIASSVSIDNGTVVMQGAIIQANTHIGKHVIINTRSSVDHDCVVEDFAHVSPGAVLCGNVQVGVGTHVGAGAVIIPNIKVGRWCKIGAGAVVTKDLPDKVVAVGVPAKILKYAD